MGSISLDKMDVDETLIPELRQYSRQLVREWGFMSTTVAGTSYNASAVHALIEISHNEGIMSAELCGPLNLDKSGVSRAVKKLVEAGEVEEEFDGGAAGMGDGRVKRLVLSEKGRETVKGVNVYGDHQVATALSKLPPTTSPLTILDGIRAYGKALRSQRLDTALTPPPETSLSAQPHFPIPDKETSITIVPGYRAGVTARTIEMQMSYYGPHTPFGFGVVFESLLASLLADLARRLDGVKNQVWCAVETSANGNENIVGVVWIDGESLNTKSGSSDEEPNALDIDLDPKDNLVNDKDNARSKKAHLRFFIVGDGVRGKGVGKKLLTEAVNFCDEKEFEECELSTFKGLNVARKMYDGLGFEIVREALCKPWDVEILQQYMTRKRGARVVLV
ncbi:uncharacterized protein PAC_14180 [Phialocephala subalpina]|uniref:N-acetyltransferase domain-containing protein n=1 Tax=Phialocephala subalpina TaxID=576137 RepID=A0A1L7XGY6_9HELO|nr:uncharacterized protein PAC_14180 [Phialocephala subalpina]